jgi:hypothetical protein
MTKQFLSLLLLVLLMIIYIPLSGITLLLFNILKPFNQLIDKLVQYDN